MTWVSLKGPTTESHHIGDSECSMSGVGAERDHRHSEPSRGQGLYFEMLAVA